MALFDIARVFKKAMQKFHVVIYVRCSGSLVFSKAFFLCAPSRLAAISRCRARAFQRWGRSARVVVWCVGS